MMISLLEIINNYKHWMHDKALMKYDLSITLDGNKYELSGIHIPTKTISYRDGDKIYTVSFDKVADIEVSGPVEDIKTLLD